MNGGRQTITVFSSWTRRPVPVPGAPTPVPGLWIAEHPRGGYMIVHRPSERVVGSEYKDPEAALAAVLEIGPLADWGNHKEPCMTIPTALVEQIDGIVRRWGGGGITVTKACAKETP